MGNKDSKHAGGDGTSSGKGKKSAAAGSNVPQPAGGATSSTPPPINTGAAASSSSSSAAAASSSSSSSSSTIPIPTSPDGGLDGSTLSPNADGRIDPLVASLDKPLTRLPELTNEKAVATNPFGERFKQSTGSVTVDDFELLKVIGKGSFGKCWGFGTKLLMCDGSAKAVEDIQEQDMLMGEDGTPRSIVAGSCVVGHTQVDADAYQSLSSVPTSAPPRMYRIVTDATKSATPASEAGWTCNGDHTLVLVFNQRPGMVTVTSEGTFEFQMLALVDGVVSSRVFQFATRGEAEAAQQRADDERATAPLVWECTVNEFFRLPAEVRDAALMMRKGTATEFTPSQDGLADRLSTLLRRPVTPAQVEQTAWVLGMWLATNGDVCYDHIDAGVVRELEAWYATICPAGAPNQEQKEEQDLLESSPLVELGQTGADVSVVCDVLQFVQSDATQAASDELPIEATGQILKALLASYGMVGSAKQQQGEKQVPSGLLRESVSVRRALLAGVIDGGDESEYSPDARRYEVEADGPAYTEGLVQLSRSLGYATTECSGRIHIAGHQLDQLKTVLPEKRAAKEDRTAAAAAAAAHLSRFTVSSISHGFYRGFQLAVSPRCLLADYTVSRNCMMVKAKGSGVRRKDVGQIFAMKVLKKAQLVARKQVAHTKTERKVLEDINHPFVCHLKYAFQTDSKLYMIFEYFPGGELFFHLKSNGRFQEERAKFYAAEIVCALECLHSNSIIYRDLKPENVMLDADGHVRIIDFGLSKEGITKTNLTHTFCGTPEYLAPEVISGGGYGLPVDWWSLGTLLYEMLTGLPPFYNQNLHVMYEKIVRAKLHYPAYLSADARGILQALLDRNPKTRLGSINDAEDVKKHPFFAGLDWAKLQRLELPAPFKPSVTEGAQDTTNVDEEFKRETPKDTPVTQSTLATAQGVQFPGFSFQAPDSNLAAQPSVLKDAPE